MVVLLYASRACYNLVVLALTNIESINSFDYDWYNVSDQVGSHLLSSLLLTHSLWIRNKAGVSPVLQADLRSSLGRRLRGVRRHSVRLGAAAHVSGGVLLPREETGPGPGEPDRIWWVFTRDVTISNTIISRYEVHDTIFIAIFKKNRRMKKTFCAF